MAQPYEESVEDQFDYSTDWQETIGNTGPGTTHLSPDAQENTRVGIIPMNKKRSAARYFLGFAYCDTVSPYFLHRENPSPDPEFPWLYAYDISFTPIAPKKDESTELPKSESIFYPELYFGNYDKVIATVRYRSYRQKFLEDLEITTTDKEWKRNTYFDLAGRVEALSSDGISQMYFDETGPDGPPYSVGPPVVKTYFKAPISELLAKVDFVIQWTNVPWEYLSTDEDYFFPTKIMNCVGKLNSDVFLGNLFPGTCLMKDPSFVIKPFPVASDDPRKPLYAVDLTIPIEYYDPENGGTGSTYRGHVLLPWRGTTDSYHAVRENGSDEILPSTAFSKIFQNVREP